MKYEWRKKEKSIYLPKNEPTFIELDEMNYITIKGEGSPSSSDFTSCVEALYVLAYVLRMSYRNGHEVKGYFEYTVYPLEGVWDLNDNGKELYSKGVSSNELHDYFVFKLMIRQPKFFSAKFVEELIQILAVKKKNPKILEIEFETVNESETCQMMHLGPYADEPLTFSKMQDYCTEHGYTRKEKYHKEIYISDPRRVEPAKLKTVLRFAIEKKNI